MPRIIKPAVGSFTASNITIDSSEELYLHLLVQEQLTC